jgi:hypothetical protein
MKEGTNIHAFRMLGEIVCIHFMKCAALAFRIQ